MPKPLAVEFGQLKEGELFVISPTGADLYMRRGEQFSLSSMADRLGLGEAVEFLNTRLVRRVTLLSAHVEFAP